MAKSKTKWKIEVIIIELILIAALLGVLFIKKVESYNFASDATYFANGVDFAVPQGSTAKVDNKTKEISIDRKGDSSLPANGIPVYYDEIKKVVLLQDVAYLKPSNGNVYTYRLPYFTELTMQDNNVVVISRDTNEAKDTSGILFDGSDTYFFLQDMYLELDDHRTLLPAFSYVKVVRDNNIEIYNSNDRTVSLDHLTAELVYVRDLNDTYRVNLETDIVTFPSGEFMLNTFINSYQAYFEANKE